LNDLHHALSDSEFIQANLFVDVIFAALQKSRFLLRPDPLRLIRLST
jgi:hypothetical protein